MRDPSVDYKLHLYSRDRRDSVIRAKIVDRCKLGIRFSDERAKEPGELPGGSLGLFRAAELLHPPEVVVRHHGGIEPKDRVMVKCQEHIGRPLDLTRAMESRGRDSDDRESLAVQSSPMSFATSTTQILGACAGLKFTQTKRRLGNQELTAGRLP